MKKTTSFIQSLAQSKAVRIGALCVLTFLATGCDMVNEDLAECPTALTLRYVFDYNMERANAFHSQVDCVTLYILDSEGNLIDKLEETSSVLSDESYRVNLDLEPGTYSFVAVGGSACEKTSFHITHPQHGEHRNVLNMQLPLDENRESDAKLHDLFFGEVSNVVVERYKNTQVTLPMIKDTNSLQVMLQELNSPFIVDVDDYEFHIEADNDFLGPDNEPVSTGGMTYRPHTLENKMAGYAVTSGNYLYTDENTPVQVASTEFHLSRLMTQNADKTFLVVTSKEKGAVNIRVPLIDYLAMSRHSGHSWIQSDQEYLDRQSTWNLMFFLQSGRWVETTVAVNDWIVRFNHAGM